MMLRSVLCFGISLSLMFAACQTGPAGPLPIMGERTLGPDGDTLFHTIPDFAFVDQDSNAVTAATFADQVYVADFFFTTCPSICPKMSQQMVRLHDAFLDEPAVALLSHSIDPSHDTVAVLRAYAQALGVKSHKWHLVTGEEEAIFDMAGAYMVSAMPDENAPGGYLHSGAFILVDKARRIRGYYDGTQPAEVDQLRADIERLLRTEYGE